MIATWSWCSTSSAAPPTVAEHRRAFDGDAVEAHRAEKRRVRSTPPRAEMLRPGASAGTRNWVSPSGACATTSSQLAWSADSTGCLRPSRTQPSPLLVAVRVTSPRPWWRRGLGKAPAGQRVAGEQALEDLRLLRIGAEPRDGARHDVVLDQRSGCGAPAELEGQQAEVAQLVVADAAAAVRLAGEQGGPAELSPLAPVVAIKADRVVAAARAAP